MTVSADPTPGDEVPRADWMEQQTDAEGDTKDEEVLPPTTAPETNTVEASEADVLDQSTEVALDDEV